MIKLGDEVLVENDYYGIVVMVSQLINGQQMYGVVECDIIDDIDPTTDDLDNFFEDNMIIFNENELQLEQSAPFGMSEIIDMNREQNEYAKTRH